jgi:hypothetical protein
MGDRWKVSIVSFIGVGHDTVGERGINGARFEIGRDDARFRLSALRAHEVDDEPARLEQRSRNDSADGIENMNPGALDDERRKLLSVRASDVLTQLFCETEFFTHGDYFIGSIYRAQTFYYYA